VRARRDRRVPSVLPQTTQTNPRPTAQDAIPPHAHVQICTHHFARLSSCTRPPIIPRESMRQETKQIPWHPPHRTVTRHGSAQRKAERSHSSKLRKTQAQEDTAKGCQPTMRNAAVCRTFCGSQTTNPVFPCSQTVPSASHEREVVGEVLGCSRAAPRYWALGSSAVVQ
jgi:hypothetical protein